jgi:hypothetical protein
MPRTARGIGRAEPLRDDAFEAKLAGVTEDDVTRLSDVLINLQPHARLGEQTNQQDLAPLDWLPPQIIAVKLNQVKGVKEDVSISAAIAQPVEAQNPLRSLKAIRRPTLDLLASELAPPKVAPSVGLLFARLGMQR